MEIPEVIDLRSDTVTRPTPEMRKAMMTCEVGDDVFDDDPTVHELEKLTAEMVGSEASLWCVTGTMANQMAIATHTKPGQVIAAGDWAHIVLYELGGLAWNSLCQLHRFSDRGGWPEPEAVIETMQEENLHTPGTGLVCLENTHNRRGGRILPMEILREISGEAGNRGIPVHLDGARIWNASVASGIPVSMYMSHVDSMMFCLSKGLASPAGSMLCGSHEFIKKAKRIRKRFGGGLRQAGILAACGLISLKELVARLDEDHKAAGDLSQGINSTGMFEIDPETIETNIVIFALPPEATVTASEFTEAAADEGLLVTMMGARLLRVVTHRDYNPGWNDAVIERLVGTMKKIS